MQLLAQKNKCITNVLKTLLLLAILNKVMIVKCKSEVPPISPKPKSYKIASSSDIKEKLLEVAAKYPQYVTLENAQELYSLPSAGGGKDCPFDRENEYDTGCKNWILTIHDKRLFGGDEHDVRSKLIPEVFLSGCLHGDERVGPTSVMEAAEAMLQAAACEYDSVGENSNECREALKSSAGMGDGARQWLAHLVRSRRTIIVPTTNALGYYRDEREENGIDPNRDFPYDLKDSSKCMQTIAARTVNEIFRAHIIQLAVTFHAGMQVVAYEWGAPTYLKYLSPDDEAQHQIADAYSRYAGAFKGADAYPVGTMNDLVYEVRGGMEDWAYAASWDPDRVITCQPNTYGGYDKAKTHYDDSTLRMFNTLVEASNRKTPASTKLGTSQDLFTPYGKGNGHITRNVRLSLLMIDIVQPYVTIRAVNHDLLPNAFLSHTTPLTIQDTLTLTWNVGGALSVDDTFLIHAITQTFQAIPDIQQAIEQPTPDKNSPFTFSDHFNGVTQWHDPDTAFDFSTDAYSYTTTIHLSDYQNGDIVQLHAVALVDQSWANLPKADKFRPNKSPQSHIVNARTNPDWHFQSPSGNSMVQGQLHWLSIPFFINITTASTYSTSNIQLTSYNSTDNSTAPQNTYNENNENNEEDYKLVIFLFIILPTITFLFFIIIAHVRKWRVVGYSHKYEQITEEQTNEINGAFDYDNDIGDDDLALLELTS